MIHEALTKTAPDVTFEACATTRSASLAFHHEARQRRCFVIPKGRVRATIEHGLERATPFLRRRLADSIELKRTPDLRFVFEAEIDMGTAE